MAIFSSDHENPKSIIDFETIGQTALVLAPAILRRLLPDGRVIGREYVAKNPRRQDRRAGSFKINVVTGRWADFATGDRGGDLIALVAYLEGVTQSEAARLLSRMLGVDLGGQHD